MRYKGGKSMPKILYEFYYVVGCNKFSKYYRLVVDRETEKMMYGISFDGTGYKGGRFAVNKSNIDCAYELCGKIGTVYRVQIDDSDFASARSKAKDIVYKHLMEIAERFRSHCEEN
jgi:hypothetical protein